MQAVVERQDWVPPWQVWDDLRRIAVVPEDGRVLLRGSHCPSGCRQDRQGPGNDRFLRHDGEESVLFEEAGPGAITRIWMTTSDGSAASAPLDPAIRVRFYFDGEEFPRIDLPLAELFSGDTAPFTTPLVGDRLTSSGGFFNYVPMAYQNGCRVTLEGADDTLLWFQLNHHRLRSDRAVATFTGAEPWTRLRELLSNPGADPWLSQPGFRPGPTTEATWTLAPGEPRLVFSADGPGLIDAFMLDLEEAARAEVTVTMRFDGETTVELPAADFFALGAAATTAPDQLPTRSLLVGLDARGLLYSYFPMPHHSRAEIWLTNRSSAPVSVASGVRHGVEPLLPDSGLFAVALHDADPVASAKDFPFLALDRPGKWVGLFAQLGSVGEISSQYLEGDERLYLDGSFHPAYYGTGVEDVFSGGFYFDQGPFGRALHGLEYRRVVVAPPGTPPAGGKAATGGAAGAAVMEEASAAYRLLLTDAVPFAANLTAGMERGPTGSLAVRARTVAYHYLAPARPRSRVDVLDLSDPGSVIDHLYQADGAPMSYALEAPFEGEPARQLAATGIRRTPDSAAAFTLDATGCLGSLMLRRRFDAQHGGQVAGVSVAGQPVGTMPYEAPNSDRRWREVDLELPPQGIGPLSFEIHAAPVAEGKHPFDLRGAFDFTEFRYELWCRLDDRIFADGFESGDLSAWLQAKRRPWPP